MNDMRNFLKGLVVFGVACGLAGCSLFEDGSRDPIAIGRTLGSLACTAAVIEKPGIKEPLAQALAVVKVALESESPSFTAINLALSKIEDDKVQTYARLTVSSVLALFPNLPGDADAKLPDQAKDALLAAIAGCNPVLGVTTTTSTSSSTSTTEETPSTVESTTTSTTVL